MSLIGTKLPKLVGQSMSALPGNSDIDLFRYGQGVIDLDTEVSDGAFDLGVAEQELHGPPGQLTLVPGPAFGCGWDGIRGVLHGHTPQLLMVTSMRPASECIGSLVIQLGIASLRWSTWLAPDCISH